MSAAILCLLLTAKPQFPLAAVFVQDEKLILSSLDGRTEVLNIGGLIPTAGDISQDKTLVVFTARAARTAPAALFTFGLSDRSVTRLETGLSGEHRTPSFTEKQATVMFAATDEGFGSPEHPTRTLLFDLKARQLVVPPPTTQMCEFNPVPVTQGAAFVATNCFGGFELRAKSLTADAGQHLADLRSPTSEVAASFDGKKLLYTAQDSGGTSLFLSENGRAPVLVHRLSDHFAAIQPAFICPRDVMFLRNQEVWRLNTESRKVDRVLPTNKGQQ